DVHWGASAHRFAGRPRARRRVLYGAVDDHRAREPRQAAVGLVRRQLHAAPRPGGARPSAAREKRSMAIGGGVRRGPGREAAAHARRARTKGASGMTLSPDEIVYFGIGPLNVSAALVFTWVVMALLVGMSLVVRRGLRVEPPIGRAQLMFE